MRKSLLFAVSAVALLAYPIGTYAQDAEAEVRNNISRAADIYHCYEYEPVELSPAPEGYTLFYLSHYGRHGSRFLEGESRYAEPLATLQKAADDGELTDEGIRCLEIVRDMADNARSRWGELSQRGVEEHRAIAERMWQRMPEIFATEGTEIRSRSTLVPRCIISMAANNERLKELNPSLHTTRDASGRWRDIFDDNRQAHACVNDKAESIATLYRMKNLDPTRLMRLLFNRPGRLAHDRQIELMQELYTLWADEQDVDWNGESLATIFNEEELIACWKCSNMRYYMPFGPSEFFASRRKDSHRAICEMIECTDRAIADGSVSADLRFIHDSGITSMMSLMGICEMDYTTTEYDSLHEHWNIYRVTPMAVNLQMMFYRNDDNDVIVRLLHCEHEVTLPIRPYEGCFYRWDDVKRHLTQRMNE
ncbi:MAG: histidine-type phosphatase [Alistipes sp.]|nr:histidine-type phosphatase [Alistipes sp.]